MSRLVDLEIISVFQHTAARRRLVPYASSWIFRSLFQHTAARRRLVSQLIHQCKSVFVSTHSRPKAAGMLEWLQYHYGLVSTHSRPKAAGNLAADFTTVAAVSTHSRPKAAGSFKGYRYERQDGFNTQPPEGGWFLGLFLASRRAMFQHTAARRRLGVWSED